MAVRTEDAAPVPEAEVRRGIIDADVHPVAPEGMKSVMPYLGEAWQRRFEAKGTNTRVGQHTVRFKHPVDASRRPDTVSPRGLGHGSDVEYMRVDLLDKWGVDIALLNSLEVAPLAAGLATPDESIALCAAFNDYFLAEWTPTDDRFRYLMCVSPQDPAAAADEIRRLQDNKAVAGVYLPPINILMGNRYFDPIYRAAVEAGLPIYVHVSGADLIYQGAPALSAGLAETYGERRVAFFQNAANSVASLIFSGTFEKFPELRVVFAEYGFAWLLPLMWRMDDTWKATRIDGPWVKRWPSEYVHDHMRFTTQPLDEPRVGKHLYQLIDMLGPDLLLFSSDYPHWDNDNPQLTLRGLEPDVREAVFSDNALSWFRLD